MIYRLGKVEINSDEYRDKFALRYNLPFMRELIDLSGCTLLEARDFIDKVIKEENIEIDFAAKEMQDYCLAELQTEDE